MNEKNLMLSSLKEKELMDLLKSLKKISYQDLLSIDSSFHFGLELEFMNGNFNVINEILKGSFNSRKTFQYNKWQLKVDTSIPSNREYILEIASPILENTKQDWQELKKVCQILNEQKVNVSPLCGGHIHIDFHVFQNNPTLIKRFLYFYALFEHVLFRYGACEYVNPRNGCLTFAKPLAGYIKENFPFYLFKKSDSPHYLLEKIAYDFKEKRSALYYSEDKDTLEFRFFNASLDPVIWQNNVNVLAHLINYCINSSYDCLTIYSKLLFLNSTKVNFLEHRKIDLKNAILFCDLIFENDETIRGKLSFLKQYLKDFEEVEDEFAKTKCFTMIKK